MSHAAESKPKSQGPFGLRVGVWLLAFGLAFVAVVTISLSRRGAKTAVTPRSLQASDTTKHSPTSSARRVTSSTPELVYQGRRLSEWIEDSRTGDFKTKAAAQDAPGIPPNEQRNTGVATLYVQHPGSARMTGSAVIPGNSFTPVVLSDTAAWVYDQCREHRTAASLVSDRADQMSGPGARIESLVRELV